jgi:magnesium transporter
MSVINAAVYQFSTGLKTADIALSDASEALASSLDNFVWVGLQEPDAQELLLLKKEFDLHELALEDSTRKQHRPKIEFYGDTIFIVLRTARLQSDNIALGHTYLFISKRYVVSIRQGASSSYSSLRTLCEQNPRMMKHGSMYILYAILDFVVDNYYPVVDELNDHLKALEQDIFGNTFKKKTIRHLYDLRRQLVDLRLATNPLHDICSNLLRLDDSKIPRALVPYLRDINDHLLRIDDLINVQSEMLNAAMDVNMAMVSASQNEVVKRLAAWAAILALPTMIASFYGMNFEFMPELKWHYGYPAVLTVMAVGCVYLWRRMRRVGWL